MSGDPMHSHMWAITLLLASTQGDIPKIVIITTRKTPSNQRKPNHARVDLRNFFELGEDERIAESKTRWPIMSTERLHLNTIPH